MSRLSWQSVTVRKGNCRLLHGVSLTAEPGEVLGIVGPNGAGKTSLLRVAAGLTRPDEGRMVLAEQPLDVHPNRQRARQIAFLPQQLDAAWPISVYDTVALGRLPHLSPTLRHSLQDVAAILKAMTRTGIDHLADRPLLELSSGETALVLLARALAVGSRVLLADEPTAALDPAHQLAVMELFGVLAADGMTICVALHDLPLAARFCDRIAVMQEGRIERVDKPAIALDDDVLERIYGIRGTRQIIDGEHLLVPWERLSPPRKDRT